MWAEMETTEFGQGSRQIKLFISSPGDVMDERKRLMTVIDRLNGRFAGSAHISPVNWPDHFYKAHTTFQAQIAQAAACDIVISIFWTRLGTELPTDFERLPDGRPYPSGTAYELLTAIEAAKQKQLPDVYVFRKTKEPAYPVNDQAKAQLFQTQVQQLLAFWEEWFVNRAGQFRAGFRSFVTTDDFEKDVEQLLLKWLADNGLLGRAVRWRIEERGSPFRSLEPFEASHASVFFGRTREIERGVARLAEAAGRGAPFLLVVGASGTGKSSLARAGLIPRLTTPGAVESIDLWRVAQMKVGFGQADPLVDLASALLDGAALPELRKSPNPTPEDLAQALASGGKSAAKQVRWALEQAADLASQRESYDRAVTPRLVLLVDQFEGLFASSVTAQQRAAFVAALDGLVRSGLVWAVATLRSAEYGHVQADPALLRLKDEGATLDLAPPDTISIAEAIRGPAEAAGLAFDLDDEGRGLDDVLLAHASGADALPPLQFTLEHLYLKRQDRNGTPTLAFESYRALGGLGGAIAAEAERAVASLPIEAQDELPWLLRQLVGVSRRRTDAGATLRDMALDETELGARPNAAALIKALEKARVLVLDAAGEGALRRARLAHEAVLRSWDRARRIVDSNARYYQQRADLEAALGRWLSANRARDHLLRGTPLSVAADLVRDYGSELPPETREFVQASRRLADRGRRIAYAIAACMALLFAGATVAGVLAFLGNQQLVVERNQGSRAQSRYISQIVHQLNRDGDHGTALALALEALPKDNDRPFDTLAQLALSESLIHLRELTTLRDQVDPLGTNFVAFADQVKDRLDVTTTALFSPDGTRLITVRGDGTAHLWDGNAKRELAVFKGHSAPILKASFSPDGTQLVTASADKTARIWDVVSGRELWSLHHEGQVRDAVFSPDGTRVLTASGDRTAGVWEATTGRLIYLLRGHEDVVVNAIFSPDGTRIFTASRDGTARLWDAGTGTELLTLQEEKDSIRGIAFSPDGTRLLTVSGSTASLWDTSSGKRLIILKGHEKAILAAAFSPDGRRVATASADGTVRLWNTTGLAPFERANGDPASELGDELAVLRGHNGTVFAAAFSPDGKHLITASEDRTARLWEVRQGRQLAVLQGHEGWVLSAAFSRDGSRILTASADRTVRLWNASVEREQVVLRGHRSALLDATFSPDGREILSASMDRTARLWRASDGKEMKVFEVPDTSGSRSWNAVFSPDAAYVATTSFGLRLWEVATGREHKLDGRNCDIQRSTGRERCSIIPKASFTRDGSRMATGAINDAIVWETATGRALTVLKGHKKRVTSVQFSPDGAYVATTSEDGTARIWETANEHPSKILKGHTFFVSSAAFSPDGHRLVTAGQDGTARSWDVASGRLLAVLRGHQAPVRTAVFSNDGTKVLTASEDGTARLWAVADGRELNVFRGHSGAVWSATFSPDGTRVLTASQDSTVRLWDANSARELATLRVHDADVRSATFSPDGARVLTASDDGTARIWTLRPDEALIERACSAMPRPLTYAQRDSFFLEHEPKYPRCGMAPWN